MVEVVDVAGYENEAVEVAAGGAAPARGALRWTDVMSSYVLNRFVQLISSGVRTDKGFKEVHLNLVAKDLKEFIGIEVTGTQVYNHLRKWRQRWVKVSKLRELSGAHWDDDNSMIVLEKEHYNGHVQAHPKDADFLNKPTENYEQMMTIYGSGLATGKYAMASSEALGTACDFADGAMKAELLDDEAPRKVPEEKNKEKNKVQADSTVGVGNKRKRGDLTDVQSILLTNMTQMTEAVNNVATAIRDTKPEEVHPELYGAVMYMPGFTSEALLVAFSHLCDNKAQGIAFVGMTEEHRVLWLRTFLTRHYYNSQ